MSETTATRKWPAWGVATITVAAAVLWLVAAYLLFRTTVPGDLHLPKLDQHDYFSDSLLARTARYERFVRIDLVLSFVATIVALLVLMRKAPRIARNTGLGPIGAGLIVAMITLATLWAVDLPFSMALRWWDDRHGLTEGSWLDWLVEPWAELAGRVAFVMLVVAVVMAFARRSPRNWWLPVTPIFIGISAVFLAGAPYLLAGGIHRPSDPQLRQDVQTLQRTEGIDVPVDVEKVSNVTKEANAFAVGLGPTDRVVVWDTLLKPPFSDEEVRVVLAHEFGHIAHHHLWKGIGWTILFGFPLAFLLARITARRGGLGDPGLLRPALAERRDRAAHERRLTPLRRRGGLVGARCGQVSRRAEGALPGVLANEPRAAEPTDVVVSLLRHASDAHAADRDGGGLEAALGVAAVGRLREVADVLPARPLRIGVVHRLEQLRHELDRQVDACYGDPGDVPLLRCFVIEPEEGERELVVREADVREVRVDARHHVGVDMDVQLSLLGFVVHAPTIYAWTMPSRRAASRLPSLGPSPSSWPAPSLSTTSRTRGGSRLSTARSSQAR
jgi:STE24 endopeptidase